MLKDYRQHDIADRVHRMEAYPLDVMLLGATGTGKSTTINAIFESETAKAVHGFEPETMNVTEYRLNNILRFWDTPRFGTVENKINHTSTNKIVDKLHETYTLRLSLEEVHDMIHSYNSEEVSNHTGKAGGM